jgi:SAM-dependent methyltransferase
VALTQLPPLDPVAVDPLNDDHPMRHVVRQVAFDPAGWTPERAARVAALFDGLAPEWHTRMGPDRLGALHDALDRGGVAGRVCLELGSGTGFATPILAGAFPVVVSADLSTEMLARAPAIVPRVLADASRLPVRDAAVDIAVLVNMLLFPTEVARVLAPHGTLVWVNTSGPATPIHLPASDVVAALGSGWTAVASSAGTGTWCVARRG